MPDPIQIIWTAVPRRRLPDWQLELAAVVSFRLGEGDPDQRLELGQFFPVLEDWQARVANAWFEIELNGGTQTLTVEPQSTPLYDHERLWSTMFTAASPVRPWGFRDHGARMLWSYPVVSMRDQLVDLYRAHSGAGAEIPTAGSLERAQGRWGGFAAARQRVEGFREEHRRRLARRADAWRGPGAEPAPIFGDPDFGELDAIAAGINFYERPEMDSDHVGDPSAGAAQGVDGAQAYYLDQPPEVDFHDAVAALGDYPSLLRALGLVLDLRFEWENEPLTDVRLIPHLDGERADICPRTHALLTPDLFLPAPAPNSDLIEGVVDLTGAGGQPPSNYDLLALDVDGAMLKAVNSAQSLAAHAQAEEAAKATFAELEQQSTPALSDSGLAIVRNDRVAHLQDRLLEQRQLESDASSGDTPELWADDLVRGYRVEIQQDGVWRSLHARDAVYRIHDTVEIRTGEDEGYVKSASATSKDQESDMYVHEAVARWSGWSLSVAHPGRTIVPKPGVDGHEGQPDLSDPDVAAARPIQDEAVEAKANAAQTEFGLATRFKARPGSLPRLRYGATYRASMTWVDLSARPAFPLDEVPLRRPSEEIVFRRYDPIGPPVVVPRLAFSEGESLERLVIRSDRDHSAADYLEQVLWEFRTARRVYRAEAERHLAAPKGSQELAERHGAFETAIGGSAAEQRAAFLIARREGGTLADPKIPDLKDGEAWVEAGSPQWEPPDTEADGHDPTAEGHDPAARGQGRYVVNDTEQLILPYLPDPLASGVVLRGLDLTEVPEGLERVDPPDGDPGLLVPFEGEWPELMPIRLRLTDSADKRARALAWDPQLRVLEIGLSKAQTVDVRYSSAPRADTFDCHGIVELVQPDDGGTLSQAESGCHWMLSPYRSLRLVHAVQRPLEEPRLEELGGVRPFSGATHADLRGVCVLHGPSTGQLDILASWSDPHDDCTTAPSERPQTDIKVQRFLNDGRWEDQIDLLVGRDMDASVVHEFADNKHHRVSYRARATTAFREYFPAEIAGNEENLFVDSPVTEVRIRSSARPPAPKVVSVVPIFGRASTEHADDDLPKQLGDWVDGLRASEGQHYVRAGGGLRIYLDRPWYETGAGERLAIVLPKGGVDDPLPILDNPLISSFGRDPIWKGPFRTFTLYSEIFHEQSWPPSSNELIDGEHAPAAEATLVEQNGRPVTLAAYTPRFDSTRNLWFCDLILDMVQIGGYWPFVRLVVARWQPHSIRDSLSPVVGCEFAQLAPHRVLNVIREGEGITLSLRGVGPSPDQHVQSVQFELQTAMTPYPDELDWAPLPESAAFVLPDTDGEELVWTHSLRLPDFEASIRVAIREYENFSGDDGEPITRIVYAETVRLRSAPEDPPAGGR